MLANRLWRRLVTRVFWSLRFTRLGAGSVIYRPLLIVNPRYACIGRRTAIRENARIEVVIRPGLGPQPKLEIGDNVNIEQGVHIICQSRLTIEDDVSITPYCVIVDTDHPFDDPDRSPKIGSRFGNEHKPVRIGKGSFIGAHSIILPGVTVGRGCVIGAGSVVTSDVPDYCVARGAPARVVRRFDPLTRQWAAVNE